MTAMQNNDLPADDSQQEDEIFEPVELFVYKGDLERPDDDDFEAFKISPPKMGHIRTWMGISERINDGNVDLDKESGLNLLYEFVLSLCDGIDITAADLERMDIGYFTSEFHPQRITAWVNQNVSTVSQKKVLEMREVVRMKAKQRKLSTKH
jgi:hypothetical protein